MKIIKSVKNLVVYGSTIALIGSGIGFHNEMNQSIDENATMTDYLIGAHRGESSLAIENTKEAIVLASENDEVDYIEVDVRMSKDGKLYLSHDDDVLTLDGNINISEMMSAEIENTEFIHIKDEKINYFDLIFDSDGREMLRRIRGLNGDSYSIISLSDAMKLFGDKKILLDLKFGDNVLRYVDVLKKFFKERDISNIVFQSDDPTSLLYFKSEMPNAFCSILVRDEESLKYIDYFDGIGIRKDVVDKEFVIDAINQDKLVLVWTIKSKQDLDKVRDELDEADDDVIYITDYPDIISKALKKNR